MQAFLRQVHATYTTVGLDAILQQPPQKDEGEGGQAIELSSPRYSDRGYLLHAGLSLPTTITRSSLSPRGGGSLPNELSPRSFPSCESGLTSSYDYTSSGSSAYPTPRDMTGTPTSLMSMQQSRSFKPSLDAASFRFGTDEPNQHPAYSPKQAESTLSMLSLMRSNAEEAKRRSPVGETYLSAAWKPVADPHYSSSGLAQQSPREGVWGGFTAKSPLPWGPSYLSAEERRRSDPFLHPRTVPAREEGRSHSAEGARQPLRAFTVDENVPAELPLSARAGRYTEAPPLFLQPLTRPLDRPPGLGPPPFNIYSGPAAPSEGGVSTTASFPSILAGGTLSPTAGPARTNAELWRFHHPGVSQAGRYSSELQTISEQGQGQGGTSSTSVRGTRSKGKPVEAGSDDEGQEELLSYLNSFLLHREGSGDSNERTKK